MAAALADDPALERHVVDLDVGADGGEELAADARVLDSGPAQLNSLAGALERDAAARRVAADEAAYAGARLERAHDVVLAGEAREQRAHSIGHGVGEGGGCWVFVDEAEGLGDEAGRELAAHGVDRQAAPAAVTEEDADLGGGEVARGFAHHELHGGEVGGRACTLRAGVRRGLGCRFFGGRRRSHHGGERGQHSLELDAVASDEGVKVDGVDRGRQRGAPGREDRLEELCGVHALHSHFCRRVFWSALGLDFHRQATLMRSLVSW